MMCEAKRQFPHKPVTTSVHKNECIVDTSAELEYGIDILKVICVASFEDLPFLLDVLAGIF
jgi:hypothetical protein